MATDRRSFLASSAALGGAFLFGGWSGGERTAPASYQGLPDVEPAPRALRILILGGTGFIGPYEVRHAVARGHHVTVFNRGMRQADLPAGVEHLRGDRNLHQVEQLRGKSWDVVIDNPTTLPFWVKDAAEVLRGNVGQYVFISTISVYDPSGLSEIDESSPVMKYEGADPLAETMETFRASRGALYGPLKAASEQEALEWFGDRTTIVRPTLIVGPGDESDRFTYWPVRIRRGGEILAPGDGTDPVQYIDARDLGEWIVHIAENAITGTFNAAGPLATLSMAAQLYGIRAALSGERELRFTWVAPDFLEQHEVRPWSELTIWFPAHTDAGALARTRVERAFASGLRFRPLAETVVDTLAWWDALPAERRAQPRAGLAAEKEAAVLAAWHGRQRTGAERRGARAAPTPAAGQPATIPVAASPPPARIGSRG